MVTIDDNAYLLIPAFARKDYGLRGNELLVFSLVYGFSQDGLSRFTGSIAYVMEWVGIGRRTAIGILNNLCQKGLLRKFVRYDDARLRCDYSAVLPGKRKGRNNAEEEGEKEENNTFCAKVAPRAKIAPRAESAPRAKTAPHNIDISTTSSIRAREEEIIEDAEIVAESAPTGEPQAESDDGVRWEERLYEMGEGWRESVAMKHGIAVAEIDDRIRAFILHQDVNRRRSKDYDDAIRHFNSWLRIVLEAERRERERKEMKMNGRNNYGNQRNHADIARSNHEAAVAAFESLRARNRPVTEDS